MSKKKIKQANALLEKLTQEIISDDETVAHIAKERQRKVDIRNSLLSYIDSAEKAEQAILRNELGEEL